MEGSLNNYCHRQNQLSVKEINVIYYLLVIGKSSEN